MWGIQWNSVSTIKPLLHNTEEHSFQGIFIPNMEQISYEMFIIFTSLIDLHNKLQKTVNDGSLFTTYLHHKIYILLKILY